MKPLRHWLRWLSMPCGRALHAAWRLPTCAWLVALSLCSPAADACARQGLRQLRHRRLVDPGRLAADQRAEPGPGSQRLSLGRHAERPGAIRWRPFPDVHARGHTGIAGHLDPRAAFRPARPAVDRHLQGTRALRGRELPRDPGNRSGPLSVARHLFDRRAGRRDDRRRHVRGRIPRRWRPSGACAWTLAGAEPAGARRRIVVRHEGGRGAPIPRADRACRPRRCRPRW